MNENNTNIDLRKTYSLDFLFFCAFEWADWWMENRQFDSKEAVDDFFLMITMGGEMQ